MFYAAVDTVEHTMTWTSAGHPLAHMQLLGTNEVVQIGSDADGGLPLAVAPGVDYPASTVPLPRGSRVLLYSDGLTDAFSQELPGHRAFGVQGLRDALRASRESNVKAALDHLFQASSQFTGGAGRHDDTSVVLMERLAEDDKVTR
jgi:serine phosphatase RsbU (regulator of sigma subunit)